MKISYAITVCNEELELVNLIPLLIKHKRPTDEIVVLFDKTNGSHGVEDYLRASSVNPGGFTWIPVEFQKDFAKLKNHIAKVASGDYIVSIDADEVPTKSFLENLNVVLEDNPEVDVFVVPRWNTVEGLTQEHVSKWGWRVDHMNRINWPDYQMRVYKNNGIIEWINPVHETLTGYLTFAPLPDPMYFNHHKTIAKQEKQNALYNAI